MRTVGQVLKEEREKKIYTLDEIEKATKIRKELLEALEAGQYLKLPPPTFVQGFIKNYGKFLGLNTEKLLAIFRREFSEKVHPPRILDSFTNPVDKKGFRMTPARALGSLILGLIIIFFVYLWIEYRFLVGGPFLEVSQPVNQYNATSSAIEVIGRTDPEAKVSINNQEIGVDVTGKFSQEIKLSGNINTIEIRAISKNGKMTKVERTVFLKI
ncbi:helix-turn-helix domain-containing protein [Candidatus Daviesbacteria bacterium]|nr:helix-turn-helix domain-containing protein [Candidatus Daviesbacteria bacterium]